MVIGSHKSEKSGDAAAAPPETIQDVILRQPTCGAENWRGMARYLGPRP
jgi:hypothetical protein